MGPGDMPPPIAARPGLRRRRRRYPPGGTAPRRRQRMFERGQCQPGPRRAQAVLPGAQPVQHARRKGVAAADPVDDAGDQHLVGLGIAVARVDPGGQAVAVDMLDMTRGRGDRPEAGKAWNAASAAARRRSSPRRRNRRDRAAARCRGGCRTSGRPVRRCGAGSRADRRPSAPRACRANCRRTTGRCRARSPPRPPRWRSRRAPAPAPG